MSSPQKTLKTLTLLHRVQKTKLEREAGALGDLRHREAQLEAQKQDHINSLVRDNSAHDVAELQYIASFVRSVKGRVAQLNGEIQQMSNRISIQEDTVLDMFAELKAYETIMDGARKEIASAEGRAEAAERDDLTSMRFTLKP